MMVLFYRPSDWCRLMIIPNRRALGAVSTWGRLEIFPVNLDITVGGTSAACSLQFISRLLLLDTLTNSNLSCKRLLLVKTGGKARIPGRPTIA